MNTRPMDNVKFGMLEPAEDEFALAAITGSSPYERIMFHRTLGIEEGFQYPPCAIRNPQGCMETVIFVVSQTADCF